MPREESYDRILGIILNDRPSVLVVISQGLIVETVQMTAHGIRPNGSDALVKRAGKELDELRKVGAVINGVEERSQAA